MYPKLQNVVFSSLTENNAPSNSPSIQHPNRRVWIAHADIIIDEQLSYAQQSQLVRKLLTLLLNHLQIVDELIEDNFPYRLKNAPYYVCFSHSNEKCAVVLSDQSAGIDIEVRDVSWQIVNRYFHPNERQILASYPRGIQQKLCNQLWEIKECLIKINQHTLTAGMGVDLSFLISELFAHTTQNPIQISLASFNMTHISNAPLSTIWIDDDNHLVTVF